MLVPRMFTLIRKLRCSKIKYSFIVQQNECVIKEFGCLRDWRTLRGDV